MKPILTAQNISAYDKDGQMLLSPMDLTILPGERVHVIAEQPRFEALARIIGGLRKPDNGEIELLGQPLREWHPLERTAHIGYMSPDTGFWEDMTVLQNVALSLIAAGISRREREDIALATLENMKIGYVAHTYPKSLGLGEQRLAALVRALVKGPELLILANPTSMLDEKETGRFVSALAEQWEADQFAVLYSTWNGSQIIPADKAIDL